MDIGKKKLAGIYLIIILFLSGTIYSEMGKKEVLSEELKTKKEYLMMKEVIVKDMNDKYTDMESKFYENLDLEEDLEEDKKRVLSEAEELRKKWKTEESIYKTFKRVSGDE